MSARLPNPNLAKIHHSYTVAETARVCRVHRNTVRTWIKQGLPAHAEQLPMIVLGADLREFLQAKRTRNKCACGPGRMYCVGCRSAKVPAGNMVDYLPSTGTSGALAGICPDCHSMIYRRVNLAKLPSVVGELEVTVTKPHSHIAGMTHPFVNSDSEQEHHT